MARLPAVIVALTFALCVCQPAGAIQRIKPVEDPARLTRRDAAIDLAERVVATAIDPRRDAGGLVTASRAASLAWKIDPELGRKLFGRVLDRAEVLLADRDEASRVVDSLPSVLSNLAVRDPDASLTAVERFARIDFLAARPNERMRLLAALSDTVARSNPAAAEHLIVASFGQSGYDARSWTAVRELETAAALRAIDAGLGSLERGTPALNDLFGAATFGQLLSFGTTVEIERNGTPANVRRWLAIAVARLEAIRLAVVSARSGGGLLAVAADELAFAQFLAPAIAVACERWYPEGREAARIAANEIGLSSATKGGEPAADPPPTPRSDGSRDDDNARIDKAYDLAREGRDREARREIAGVVNDEARRGAADETELILAADAGAKSRWADLERRLANVSDRALRIHALGAAAVALSASGARDIAERLAAEALRLSVNDMGGYGVAAGLVNAAIVFDALGDVARSADAVKLALKVIARIESDGPIAASCRCWPFVPVSFGTVTVSTGLKVGPADIRLEDVLGAMAKRDLAGVVGLATGVESVQARELAELALVRALIAQGV